MPRLDDYMQIAEAAEYLGVCKNTLRNWGEAGWLSEYRHPVNNYRLYKKTDLNKLLNSIAKAETPPSKPR